MAIKLASSTTLAAVGATAITAALATHAGGVLARRATSDRSEPSIEAATATAGAGAEVAAPSRAARRPGLLRCFASSAFCASLLVLTEAAAARCWARSWIRSCASLLCCRRRWACSRRFLSSARARLASRTASISQHSRWNASSSSIRETFAAAAQAMDTTATIPSTASQTSASMLRGRTPTQCRYIPPRGPCRRDLRSLPTCAGRSAELCGCWPSTCWEAVGHPHRHRSSRPSPASRLTRGRRCLQTSHRLFYSTGTRSRSTAVLLTNSSTSTSYS